LLGFSKEVYVGLAAEWIADIRPNDQYALVTTLAPDLIGRAEKGTDNIVSGKSSFRTPEPPTVVMLLIGTGLIFVFSGFRTVHRSGRRRVRAENRKMARI
jgi:hypothetical protein